MTDPNEPSMRRFTGILFVCLGLIYISVDFDRAGSALHSGWRQLPLLAALGGMMVCAGAIQIYWRIFPRFFALGWLYFIFGAGDFLKAAIDWKPGQHTFSMNMVTGVFFVVAAVFMFKAARDANSEIGEPVIE